MLPSIHTVEQLEELLSEPTSGVIETLANTPGDIILLGVAGKMGPTLARMAKRASDLAKTRRRVIGVSRFSSATEEAKLQAHGIETIRCDLLNEEAVRNLPEAPNVIFLAGMKFGSTGQASLTWAMNTHLPSIICKKYSRSKIVALSTGNVYGLVPVTSSGSVETDSLNPVGEYAMSCLGRERIFEHFSRDQKTPIALVRLNYACELRYGVVVDIAQQIAAGKPVNVDMGWFNTIWQGDANAMILQCLNHVSTPPRVINLTGPEKLSVRETGKAIARQMNCAALFQGCETENALLSDARQAFSLFGKPRVSSDEIIARVAEWFSRGGTTLGKPTHFESRDGKF